MTAAEPIDLEQLRRLAATRFGDMIKGVVDLRREVLLLDAELHVDQEARLLEEGSDQQDLWASTCFLTWLARSGWSSTR